jgi:hypothetical protein
LSRRKASLDDSFALLLKIFKPCCKNLHSCRTVFVSMSLLATLDAEQRRIWK